MLFTQQNGLAAPAENQSEIDVLQNLACGIGPRVDGIAASLALPQAMGGFITQGAAGACAGRNQQYEQHQPTIARGLGETAPTTSLFKLAIDPAKLALIKASSSLTPTALPVKTAAEPVAPAPSPAAPAEPTYPAGSITAFDVTTNMWRIAVPTVAAGFGMFGAAAPYTEVTPTPAPKPGLLQVSLLKLQSSTGQLPLYKNWKFWAAIAGGTALLGTGTVLLYRRKRA